MTWEDIRASDERGRWWRVGASWAGKQAGAGGGAAAGDGAGLGEEGGKAKRGRAEKEGEETLQARMEKLAAKQRMNTDVRRGIFCAIMAATDYEDAFERLMRLNLRWVGCGLLVFRCVKIGLYYTAPAPTIGLGSSSSSTQPTHPYTHPRTHSDQQEREVIRVLVDCAGQEARFNPYYAYLAGRLCEFQDRHKFTLQLTFWDMCVTSWRRRWRSWLCSRTTLRMLTSPTT